MSVVVGSSAKPQRAMIDRDTNSILPDFIARQEARDRAHIRSLAKVVRNGQPLDAILVWRDPEAGSLVLLDGAYRLSAYDTAEWEGPIPARIVECSRSDALLLAAGANSKDRKGLTPKEKQDFAWRLVRDPEVKCSRSALAKATGVSEASIARMRRRWKELAARVDFNATGVWFRDQADRSEDITGAEMTDAAKEAAIAEYIGKMRDLMDWRKGHPILRDEHARFAIVAGAFGHPTDQALAEWILGGEDEADDWMTGEVNPVADYSHLTKFENPDEEDEVNPDF